MAAIKTQGTAQSAAMAAAEKHGWTVSCDVVVHEFRRRRGRRVECIAVTFDVYGRIVSASWSPTLNGTGGRRSPDRNKRQWLLDRLTAPS